MSFADSFGVMPDCKHTVYKKSNETFTPEINGMFTVRGVTPDRIAMARFAFRRAEQKFGWSKAEFAKKLFGGVDGRGRIGNWKRRGVPPEQDAKVAALLELTVEELQAAGKIQLDEDDIPPEAIAFAREWYKLSPAVRTQIQALVQLLTMETGRIEGNSRERPELQRLRRA